MTRYEAFVQRQRHHWGDKFSESDLAPHLIPYFNSQQRIEVRFPYGACMRGRVGATGGWRPVFLLMRRRSDHSSPIVLGPECEVVRTIPERTRR